MSEAVAMSGRRGASGSVATSGRSAARVGRAVRRVAVLAVALVGLLAAACGGSRAAEPTGPRPLGRKAGAPRAVPVQPLEIEITPSRAGGALQVGIAVLARGHGPGEAFEDPAAWTIEARDDRGAPLRRIMNGPHRVERAPVGSEDGSQWDVSITGAVFFDCPAHVTSVAVRVAVPGAAPVEVRADLQ